MLIYFRQSLLSNILFVLFVALIWFTFGVFTVTKFCSVNQSPVLFEMGTWAVSKAPSVNKLELKRCHNVSQQVNSMTYFNLYQNRSGWQDSYGLAEIVVECSQKRMNSCLLFQTGDTAPSLINAAHCHRAWVRDDLFFIYVHICNYKENFF